MKKFVVAIGRKIAVVFFCVCRIVGRFINAEMLRFCELEVETDKGWSGRERDREKSRSDVGTIRS